MAGAAKGDDAAVLLTRADDAYFQFSRADNEAAIELYQRVRNLQKVVGNGLLLPAGPDGPAFLSLRNFDAFYSYNAAESYGLAIAHLADRLAGAGPFLRAWPTDDPPLSRAQRRELQALLIARGHDIGDIDGRLGELSRGAIRAEQKRLGQDVSGRGGMKLLLALRGE